MRRNIEEAREASEESKETSEDILEERNHQYTCNMSVITLNVPSYQSVNAEERIIRVKPIEIKVVKNVEKKMEFCDRQYSYMLERDSGKQIYVELQTVIYEYFKNHGLQIMSKLGPTQLKDNPIDGKDLNDANVETQLYLNLKTKNDVEYSVTYNMYHTNCTILIQNLKSKNRLDDGRFPCRAFCEDYLDPALKVIATNVDIEKETNLIKEHISKTLKTQQNSSHTLKWCCQLCQLPQPPLKTLTQASLSCEQCRKYFHIQCLNKNHKNKFRATSKHFICNGCKMKDQKQNNSSPKS